MGNGSVSDARCSGDFTDCTAVKGSLAGDVHERSVHVNLERFRWL